MTMIIIILIIILIVLFVSQAIQKRPVTENMVASSLRDFNLNEKEEDRRIIPSTIWTYRYLSKYYSKLLHEWMIEMELDQLGKITPVIRPFAVNDAAQAPLDSLPKVKKIVQHLLARLNSNPPVVIQPTFFYQKNDIIMIPLDKQSCYNTKIYYQQDLNANTNNLVYMIMRIREGKVVSMAISGLPKLVSFQGTDKFRTQNPQEYISRIGSLHIDHNSIGPALKKTVTDRFNYILSRCFFTKDMAFLHNTDNEIGNEQGCVISGGVWDTPCNVDKDCPYFRANKNYPNDFGGCDKNSGFCKLPDGLTNLSYKKSIGTPICYSCKSGGLYGLNSLGPCCKGPTADYKFKGDYKKRHAHKNELTLKGLNWYQY